MKLVHGRFGLEKESLRITLEGRFAQTDDPFGSLPHVTRDFCENQTEINTGVHDSAEGAVEELVSHHRILQKVLYSLPEREVLWPFSNPPFIENEEEIPIARYTGKATEKRQYREYLADRYGRHLMTFSGVHVNYSFDPDAIRGDRNQFYLDMAEKVLAYGWILTPLFAASPLLDESFCISGHHMGETMFAGLASIRCSELGYWNQFTPVLDYSTPEQYTKSIRAFVDRGFIIAPSEFYYPVRLKPRGQNSLAALTENGVDHIELRTVDLNPFVEGGVDVRDIRFIELFLGWCASLPKINLSVAGQLQAIQNFKRAAHYDITCTRVALPGAHATTVQAAGLSILDRIDDYYKDECAEVKELIEFERCKYTDPASRPAVQVFHRFSPHFATHGLGWALHCQEDSIQHV